MAQLLKNNPLYRAWTDMKTRCSNPNYNKYHRYVGRGITFCDRWNKFSNFKEDMGKSFKVGLQLDRINNDKGYSPENCKWSTRKEQANNKNNNKLIKYKGKIKTLTQWSEYLNIKRSTLAQRFYVYGWRIDKCFTFERGSEVGR